MVLASSTTRILSMLLLFLTLFKWGLQTPVRHSAISSTASTLSCPSMAKEIVGKLNGSELIEDDVTELLRYPPHSSYMEESLPSQDKTMQRANLCEFLKMRKQLKIEAIKTNLENLERCLPEAVNTSKMTAIFLDNDLNDYQKKLKFFVSQLNNLRPTATPASPHPTSGSAFCPESKG
ncbi:hypothetical protein STEG23_034425 [Scotinomys teguina]